MGVRGLQYYLENCCQPACQQVDIAELVQNYRIRNRLPNEELVIVVDGSSCIRILYSNLEWIGGGQLKQFGEKAQFFVSQFARLNVRLVFFFDGPTAEEKRRTWIERRLSKVDSMYFVLDKIERGHPSRNIDRRRHFHLPPGMGQLSRVIFDNLCGCVVHQSLTENDEEIALYAKNHGAFAILSQDSDFVIYDKGEALYLSMEKLDLQDMTTLLYDGERLADYLNLNTTQLPLLATLMGNDIIDFKEIKPFHIRMMRHRFPSQNIDFRRLIPNLAMEIRRMPRDPDRLYEDVSSRLFGTPDRAEEVCMSITSYQPSPEDDARHGEGWLGKWGQLLAEAKRRHQRNEFPSMVYAIMSGLPFESSASIEDFRKDDLPSFAEATEVLRQRIYGILLQEKPMDPGETCHHVEEWCMAGPGSLDESNIVPAISPQPRHPGLSALWAKNRPEMGVVRWQLLVTSVASDLDMHKVRLLPGNLLIPTLVLAYLESEETTSLEPWEVDVVLATAVCLPEYTIARLAELPADPMATRGIRVANLVMRVTFVLYLLLAACGYPASVQETAPWLFFDGKLFQLKYNSRNSGCSDRHLCDDNEENLQWLLKARKIIFRQT